MFDMICDMIVDGFFCRSVYIRIACVDQVVEVFHEGDMIWVHGFHLAILPAFLDRTVKVRNINDHISNIKNKLISKL